MFKKTPEKGIGTMGRRISQLREAHGYTQQAFARQLGVSQGAVARWEGGDKLPSIEKLGRLIDLTNSSADYLLYGKHRFHLDIEALQTRNRKSLSDFYQFLISHSPSQ